MTDNKVRAALEAAKEWISFDNQDTSLQSCQKLLQQIDEALKSEPDSSETPLEQKLMSLPEEIERNANTTLELQVTKCQQGRELDLLHAEIAFGTFSDPEYKNDTARRAQLVIRLQTSGVYQEKQKALAETKISLERAKIAWQRSRDMFDAYRAIAQMQRGG